MSMQYHGKKRFMWQNDLRLFCWGQAVIAGDYLEIPEMCLSSFTHSCPKSYSRISDMKSVASLPLLMCDLPPPPPSQICTPKFWAKKTTFQKAIFVTFLMAKNRVPYFWQSFITHWASLTKAHFDGGGRGRGGGGVTGSGGCGGVSGGGGRGGRGGSSQWSHIDRS